MYKYKGTIPVPSLQMVDEVMVLGRCSSLLTVQSSSVVNSFMNKKKLTLSQTNVTLYTLVTVRLKDDPVCRSNTNQ